MHESQLVRTGVRRAPVACCTLQQAPVNDSSGRTEEIIETPLFFCSRRQRYHTWKGAMHGTYYYTEGELQYISSREQRTKSRARGRYQGVEGHRAHFSSPLEAVFRRRIPVRAEIDTNGDDCTANSYSSQSTRTYLSQRPLRSL